ncbi:retrotransposable element [Pimephales promelas]|nr:retrotransposable element [Pimephales promelas]
MVSCEKNYVQPQNASDTEQSIPAVKDDKWTAPLLVNGTLVTFKIDTGAKANLINENDLKALAEKPKRVTDKEMSLKAYNNQPIRTMGGCRLKVTAKGRQHNLMFTIVPTGHESILGDKASEDLGLVKRIYQINSDKIDNQTKKLSQSEDPKDLNENIKREHYQIPKREEILSDMAGANYFSKLDASHGFWQLKLDPESSRSLTETEKRYAQIEKETLGLVFGIQRMMMTLQRYDFDLIYTPGKYIVLADTLSRAPELNSDTAENTAEEEIETHINMVTASLPATDTMLQQIVKETAVDSMLLKVAHCVNNGWSKGVCPQFFPVRAELCMSEGLLLRKNRIVIPQTMRKDMLQRLHEGHLGVEKCKRRAREAIYWPGINKDIEETIAKCDICIRHHYKQVKEPMLVAELPNAPWQKGSLPDTIPQCVVSDNGPQYDCGEFKEFAKHYGFKHVTSSSLYPQANGQAEKGVQIVKRLLKKAKDGKTDPHLALLSYRAAPLECGASPAELLMKRKLRTTLPQLQPGRDNNKWMNNEMKLKIRQKMAYDRATKSLEPLCEKDTVRIEGPNC